MALRHFDEELVGVGVEDGVFRGQNAVPELDLAALASRFDKLDLGIDLGIGKTLRLRALAIPRGQTSGLPLLVAQHRRPQAEALVGALLRRQISGGLRPCDRGVRSQE
jgi:hypothetical protein